jgi:uncharacterized repeat protein (TIGR01451 family)
MKLRHLSVFLGAFHALGAAQVFAQQPSIISFSPFAGTPGDTIKIFGTGFSAGHTKVYFWNGNQASVTVSDSAHLTAIVPAGTTTGALGVQQDTSQLVYTSSNFLAVGSGPYIASFSPTVAATSDTLVIYGVHFTGTPLNGVKFSNNAFSQNANPNADGTQISVQVPFGATNGLFSVTSSTGTTNSPGPLTIIGPGPYIADFTPSSGGMGTTIQIDGRFFLSATNATFNGVPGNNFVVNGDLIIHVDAPPGVTSGRIAVNSPKGTYVTSSNFFAPPTITGLSPTSGRTGTNVTISGTSLIGATAVYFSGIASTNFTVVNNSTIRAFVPAGVSNGLVRVTTPLYSCFSSNNFTVQPTLYGFAPNAGGSGTSVTITGANFNVGTPTVLFNGTPAASVSGVSFGQLTAVVPAAAMTGPITVSTTDGSSTSANTFYMPASITGFSPNFGPAGTWITISGRSFLGASAVSFNGIPATAFFVTNNTTLGARVPAGVQTGPLSVTVPANTATSTAAFYGAPGITNFVPTHGIVGTSVTLFGTNLVGATAVRFNGVNAPINSNDGNQIATSVPAGTSSGPISVVTPGGTNTTSANFVVDKPSEMEIWGSAAPNPASVGNNLLYTITIVNYGPNDAPNVLITNTLPASVTFKSASINQGTVNTSKNPITGNLGTMVSGAAATLLITVVPSAPGFITNAMSVVSDNPDPQPTNNFATIETFVQSAPRLSIRQVPINMVQLSWPLDVTNFVLQSKYALTNGTWSSVASPVFISNNQYIVLEPITNSSKFYRLTQ